MEREGQAPPIQSPPRERLLEDLREHAAPLDEEKAPASDSSAASRASSGRYENWGVRAALFALTFYKAYLSPVFAGTCRYQPTCSRYAYEAIERFGVLRGGWLALRRLLACHPFSGRFGYDPVPEKWEKMQANAELLDKTREVRP